jgi:hypothetical protein
MKKRTLRFALGKKDAVVHYCEQHAEQVDKKAVLVSASAICVVKEHVCDFCEPAKTAKE